MAANIAAIGILKQLQDEDRAPTPDEQAALVRYVGWGAFAQAIFDKNPSSRNASAWREERRQLADLLTAEEWSAARASTVNAHYTSEAVIRGIWSAVQHLGFTGGRVLEPSAGIGHFIGLTPEPLRDEIAWTAVELDPLTGGIAKALYSGADLRVQGFETARWPDGFFDLAISNVPFGDYGVHDPRYPRSLSIHDYFFLRGLEKVRPGGLVAFITSRYTLDKESEATRREIARHAEFLGAIRLPGGRDGAFAANAGTEVTSDIIFLRRRFESEAPANESWLPLAEIATPDGPVRINGYFAGRPEMMLGAMRLQNTMHAAAEPMLVGTAEGLETRIAEAVRTGLRAGAFTERSAPAPTAIPEPDIVADGIKEGAFYLQDGVIHRKIAGIGVRQELSRSEAAKLVALIALRDTVNELLRKQAVGEMDGREALRRRLNQDYDAFHRRYGPINKTTLTVTSRLRQDGTPVILRRLPNFAVFRDDPDAYKVAAIENYDETEHIATKAAIFSHDILRPDVAPEVSSPADALALSLDRTGKVDIGLIAGQLAIAEEEAIAALGEQIFLDPAGDVWRTRDDYLSGDVVGRLEDARAAAEADQRYRRNVAALEAVQPAPLTRIDIRVLCGAPWVPVDVYRGFLKEQLGIEAGGLMLNAYSKKWSLAAKPAVPDSAAANYGTERSSVIEVILAALNNAEIRVMDRQADGNPVYNAKASEESNAKVKALRDAFSGAPEAGIEGWVWQDEARARRLEAIYNHSFNRLVRRAYDGGHQTMPGMVRYLVSEKGDAIPFKLHGHQLNAVWRVVASGNTLLDHAVGAGKTFTMIAAGMEQKRLGLIQRPMFAVPNHMLEQFSREFLQAYPNARILVADKEQMSRARRREFAARVAAERWDGIVITHDAFGRIAMSDEAYAVHIRRELEELADFKERAAREEGNNAPTVKDLEKARKRLAARLEDLLGRERKDEGVTFEELGVDFLFVDEAHLFKNLEFRTRHTRVKGLAARASQRATDLFLKVRHLDERRPGRSAVFATGTPVSNSIAEMYTVQRYLQLGALGSYGIAEFDAWAATFGDIVTQLELAPSGKGFRTVRSFSKFVNIPELIALYSCVADTQTAEMLKLPRPKLQTGMVQVVEAEMSARESAYMAALVARADAIKGKRPEKGDDNMLKIMSEGLQLATDIRLIDPDAPFNPDGKIAKAIGNIARIWRDGGEPGLAQIVFLDMGVPGSTAKDRRTAPGAPRPERDDVVIIADDDEDAESLEGPLAEARFNLYAALRDGLVATGIPAPEIAFIHDANSDDKKARLFAAVRAGKIRVLIGSTGKMGVGTNVQKRLIAMHHIDAPWRPADVEQRDGRILRQGNLNPEIAIYRYITKASLDAYRWQVLNTKANFIGQLRAGARGVRVAEDIDSPLPEAAMIKAAATGDPRIMEHAELSKAVRELEAALRGHERSRGAARRAYDEAVWRIGMLETRIAEIERDAAAVADLGGDRFQLTLTLGEEPVTLRERRVAGETLLRHLLREGARVWGTQTVQHTVGELSGFKMQAGLKRAEGQLQIVASLASHRLYSRDEFFPLDAETDAVGLIRRFESLLKHIPNAARASREEHARLAADLPRLERQMAAAPFARQEQLDAAKSRLARLDAALQAEEAARTTPPAPASPPPKPDADLERALIPHPARPAIRPRSAGVPSLPGGAAMKQDYVRAVAERLIEQLEQGTAPWVKPWSPGARFMPYNPVTGREYRGMNAILLLAMAQAASHGDARWMTYRQAGGLGGQVRRGEQGTWIQYWKWRDERPILRPDGQPARDADGRALVDVIDHARPRVFRAVVFNAAQIDGLPPPAIRPALPDWERHERAESILTRSGADIRHERGDRAAYSPGGDFIVLPERGQFPSADGYYATALHELGHYSGHPSRLNRDLHHPHGSENYAREELRAEIASLMLGDRLNIGYNISNHAAYISHYIAILKDDPTEIFRAAGDAETIVSYLRRFERRRDIDQAKAIGTESVAMPARASALLQQAQPSSGRVYLAVPYGEKNAAKALGAKWDKQAQCWYAPPGADLAKFARWRNRPITEQGHEDSRAEFAAALAAAGLILDGLPIMDGKLRRVVVEGGRRGERDGAYVGHLDGHPAGFIENFKTGYRANWKSQMPREVLSAADRARLANEVAEHQRCREQERRAIAAETARLVERLLDGTPAIRDTRDHPYLERKGVRAHGVYRNEAGPLELFAGEDKPQIWSARGELLVPIRDIGGALLGAQSIAADGFKLFPRGAALAGGHHLIGDVAEAGRLLIAEGYATGATLHEATGLPVAVAFNAGNLEPVARAYRERFPNLAIAIAGDNDHQKERETGADGRPRDNVGRIKAEAAAKAVGGVALIPPFRTEEAGSDWNDIAQLRGDGFREMLRAALASAERQQRVSASRQAADRSASPAPALLRGNR